MRRTSCKVVKISDGDTITVQYNTKSKRKLTVRLFGIDAPELKQSFGLISKKYLSDLIINKDVLIEFFGEDQYGRALGKVYLGDACINEDMVKSGLAHWYKEYTPDEIHLAELQHSAQSCKLGLWSDSEVIVPWKWRIMEKIKVLQEQLNESKLIMSREIKEKLTDSDYEVD